MSRIPTNAITPFAAGSAGALTKIIVKLMQDASRPISAESRMGLSRRKARKLAYRYRSSSRGARYEAYLAGQLGKYIVHGGRLVDCSKLMAKLAKLAKAPANRLQFLHRGIQGSAFAREEKEAAGLRARAEIPIDVSCP